LMLRAAGQLDQAYEMQRRVMEVTERVFGPNHGRTIGALLNLGNTLHDLGRTDDAEAMLLESLRRSERDLGPDANETIHARMSVSNFYHRENRHPEARPLMEAVLRDRRRIHGDKHPNTLHAVYNLGANALAMEEFERAAPFFAEIIRAVPESLPPANPVTL